MNRRRAWEVIASSPRGPIRVTVLASQDETARAAFYRDCGTTGWRFQCAEEITTEYWEAIRVEREQEESNRRAWIANHVA